LGLPFVCVSCRDKGTLSKPKPVRGERGLFKGSESTQGFKNFTDLSTKLLGKLEGRTTVSKQFISDLTNSPDLKQPEKELFRRLLADEGGTINVKDFADKVKSELLPLKSVNPAEQERGRTGRTYISNKYENITLPSELRGPVANYDERVYESPIKTSAGDVHFNGSTNNYFAHSRIEDLADNKTRRVIEAQSDLFQKGRLEKEGSVTNNVIGRLSSAEQKEWGNLTKNDTSDLKGENPRITELRNKAFKLQEEVENARTGEVAKLEPYRNTWHERIVREEVKQAAKDSKTKLQFPTGETAMKIEGLGENVDRWNLGNSGGRAKLTTDNLKVGLEVQEGMGNQWIITDILGDGKFKAVQKRDYDMITQNKASSGESSQQALLSNSETFDISGTVDKENPIYKFYEKEMGKYLKNKYNATLVTDAQGVTWYEVPVGKEKAKLPVEAFALAPLAMTALNNKDE